MLSVGINTQEFYGYSQQQKTEEFKGKYKKRSCQEWKKGEMKQFHGLDRARGYGLKSMSTQAKLTVLAVNLKRIASILSSQMPVQIDSITILLKEIDSACHLLKKQAKKMAFFQWSRTGSLSYLRKVLLESSFLGKPNQIEK